MNIALIGYGKMGHMIEKVARQRKHMIVAKIDPQSPEADYKEIDCKEINQQSLHPLARADVYIDFTHPEQVVQNIKKVAALGKNLVVAPLVGMISSTRPNK